MLPKPYRVEFETFVYKHWRLILACVVAGQSVVFSLGLGVDEGAVAYSLPAIVYRYVLPFSSCVLVAFLLWKDLWRSCQKEWKLRRFSVSCLFLSLMGVLFVFSAVSILSGLQEVQFAAIAALLSIKVVMERVECYFIQETRRVQRAQSQVFDAAYLLAKDGSRSRVPVIELCKGESLVSVHPGEPFTVDGEIVEGYGRVHDLPLSGRLEERMHRVGDSVLAGTYSVDGFFVVRPLRLKGARRLESLLAAKGSANRHLSLWQITAKRLSVQSRRVAIAMSVLTFFVFEGSLAVAILQSAGILLAMTTCAFPLITSVMAKCSWLKLYRMGLVSRHAAFLNYMARSSRLSISKQLLSLPRSYRMTDMCLEEGFVGARKWMKNAASLLHAEWQGYDVSRTSDLYAACSMQVQAIEQVDEDGIDAVVLDGDGRSSRVSMQRYERLNIHDQMICDEWMGPQRLKQNDWVFLLYESQLVAGVGWAQEAPAERLDAIEALKSSGMNVRAGSVEDNIVQVHHFRKSHRNGGMPFQMFLVPSDDSVQDLQHFQSSVILFPRDNWRRPVAARIMGQQWVNLPAVRRLALSMEKTQKKHYYFTLLYNASIMAMLIAGLLSPVLAALCTLCMAYLVGRYALTYTRNAESDHRFLKENAHGHDHVHNNESVARAAKSDLV